jgi:large repetitive protein
MAGARQITFDPEIWSSPNQPGPPGVAPNAGADASNAWLDNDGATAWAFEAAAGGYAHFDINTGTILHEDTLFGQPASSNVLYYSSLMGAAVIWKQDAAGFYYTLFKHSGHVTIYKFHLAGSGPITHLSVYKGGKGFAVNDTFSISGGNNDAVGKVLSVDSVGGVTLSIITTAGTGYTAKVKSTTTATSGVGTGLVVSIVSNGQPGTLLNGYEIIDGTFDTAVFFGGVNPSQNIVLWHGSDGNNYLGMVDDYSSKMYVINTDTMTPAGYFDCDPSFNYGGAGGFQSFVDKYGALWGVYEIYGAPSNVNTGVLLSTWSPSNGFLTGPIETSTLNFGGTSYAPNDTFTVDGGGGNAAGTVLTVTGGGVVSSYVITSSLGKTSLDNGGASYIPGTAFTVTTGTGDATGVVDTVGGGGAVLTYHITGLGTSGYAVGTAVPTVMTTAPLTDFNTSIGVAGANYEVGDTFTVTSDSGDAVGTVLTVGGGGSVSTYSITVHGTAYTNTVGAVTSTVVKLKNSNTSIGNAGTGFHAGDFFSVQAGNYSAIGTVLTVGGGGNVLTYNMAVPGDQYPASTNNPTQGSTIPTNASTTLNNGGGSYAPGDTFAVGFGGGERGTVSTVDGSGAVLTYNITGGGQPTQYNGVILCVAVAPLTNGNTSLNNGGLDYAPGDTFAIEAPVGGYGSGAIGTVDTVNGSGTILTYHISTAGSGYTTGTCNSTTLTGVGFGATLTAAFSGNGFSLNVNAGTGLTIDVNSGTGLTLNTTPTGSGLTLNIDSIGSGTNYSLATGKTTTATSGGGSGLMIDITGLAPSANTVLNTQIFYIDPTVHGLSVDPYAYAGYVPANHSLLVAQEPWWLTGEVSGIALPHFSGPISNDGFFSVPATVLNVGGANYAAYDTFTVDGGSPLATGIVMSVDGGGAVLTYLLTGGVGIAPIASGGAGGGYAPGDTFTVDHLNGTGTAATGTVQTVDGGGGVLLYTLTGAGTNYYVVTGVTTTTTSGGGSGLTLNIDYLSPMGGDGYVKATGITTTATSGIGVGFTLNIDFITGKRVSWHADDQRLFSVYYYDSNVMGFDVGVQNDGTLMLEGNGADPFQAGGVLNIVDPTTLTVTQTIDATRVIVSESPNITVFPGPRWSNNILVGPVSLAVSDGVNATYTTTHNNMIVGAHAGVQNMLGVSAVGGNVNTVTPTDITVPDATAFTAHTQHPPQLVDGPPYSYNNRYSVISAQGTSYPGFMSYTWSKANSVVLCTYLWWGSPIYIVPTNEPLYAAATGGPVSLTVTTGTTSTAITSIVTNPAYPSSSVQITAQVTAGSGPNPSSGTVQFYDNVSPIGSPVSVNGSGVAILTTSSFATVGSHPITASFTGVGYSPSTSPSVPLSIVKAPTTTTITSYNNPAVVGLAITFRVVVNQPDGGTVTLTDTFNSVTTTLTTLTLTPSGSTSTVNYTTSSLAYGLHTITATYSGDSTYSGSTGTVLQHIVHPSDTYVYLPSFALVGTYSAQGDTLLPPAAVAVLVPTETTGSFIVPNTPLFVIWNTTNISQVRITGDNGVDAPLDSGFIITVGQDSGSFEIPSGFTHDITLTFLAYPNNITSPPVVITQMLSVDFASGAMTGIAITPSNPTLTADSLNPSTLIQTQQFVATATYEDSSTAILRSSAAVWASTNTVVATVNSTGLASTTAAGATTISSIYGTFTASTLLTLQLATVNNLVISGHAVPWIVTGTINTMYSTPGQSSGSTPPATIATTPGKVVTIQYLSGLWTVGGTYSSTDANGRTSDNGRSSGEAGYYIPPSSTPVYAQMLIGGFADSTGQLVAPPVAIGNHAVLTTPAGATQLVMGMNDGTTWNDNGGSLTVEYTVI